MLQKENILGFSQGILGSFVFSKHTPTPHYNGEFVSLSKMGFE